LAVRADRIGEAESSEARAVSGNSASIGFAKANLPDCESTPFPFKARNTSVQLLQLPGTSNAAFGWTPEEGETVWETQHSALTSSTATWLPGAMQSTEEELGDSSNTIARSISALFAACPANPAETRFMFVTQSKHDTEIKPCPQRETTHLALRFASDESRIQPGSAFSFVIRKPHSQFISVPTAPFSVSCRVLLQDPLPGRTSCRQPCNASRRPDRGLLL
jgi:hypothetical protein